MSQMGFFDIANRYARLDAKNDPLLKIDEVVRWEDSHLHGRVRFNGMRTGIDPSNGAPVLIARACRELSRFIRPDKALKRRQPGLEPLRRLREPAARGVDEVHMLALLQADHQAGHQRGAVAMHAVDQPPLAVLLL